jgi:hypothetical protein
MLGDAREDGKKTRLKAGCNCPAAIMKTIVILTASGKP